MNADHMFVVGLMLGIALTLSIVLTIFRNTQFGREVFGYENQKHPTGDSITEEM